MSKNLTIGARVGAGVGVVAGAAVGAAKANKILTPLKASPLKLMAKEQYVNSRIAANMETLQGALKGKKLTEGFAKVAKKAAMDYPNILKTAKKSSIKWVAGLAIAGVAVGTTIGLIADKIKKNAHQG